MTNLIHLRDFLTRRARGLEAADAWPQRLPQTLARIAQIGRDVASFERRWPQDLTALQDMAPPFSWGQLERQLTDLVEDPVKKAMAQDLISATRKLAPFKPPEMVLREILCLSWALLDEEFHPDPTLEEG